MPTEIERKFLVDHQKWAAVSKPAGKDYKQGYILSEEKHTVRIRVTGDAAFLTLKGPSAGITRSEYEYRIPVAEGAEILASFAMSGIQKTRYNVEVAGHTWEVDVFAGENSGLIVAEIELKHEDETFEKPDWIGREVSTDTRYTNAALSVYPYNTWK